MLHEAQAELQQDYLVARSGTSIIIAIFIVSFVH